MSALEQSDSPKLQEKPASGPPESPTTARALEFDSDQEAEHATSKHVEEPPKPPPKPKNITTPSKPPQALNPREQAEMTLREAFPTIEPSVIKAVLIASGGTVEPAFNALLAMTDPDTQNQGPPAKPPRPVSTRQISSTSQEQLDADELYARQLQEHYSGAQRTTSSRQRPSTGGNRKFEYGEYHDRYNQHLQGSRVAQGRPGGHPNPDNVHWRSFFDDDLPEIRDNIRKGFLETQSTVNNWLSGFKAKMDGREEDGETPPPQPPRPGGARHHSYDSRPTYTPQSPDSVRRSADLSKYDADPQLIGDDFSKLGLREGDAPPRTSSRPLANPNLFRSNSGAGGRKSPGPRKVAFQAGPPEEIKDLYSGPNKPGLGTTPPNAKGGKWQPISAAQASPVHDNDPFSLGDSDDERDAKPITLKDVEAEPMKDVPAEPLSDHLGGGTKAGVTK